MGRRRKQQKKEKSPEEEAPQPAPELEHADVADDTSVVSEESGGEDDTPPSRTNKRARVDIDTSASPTAFVSDGKYRNKQRCLLLCSRGVTARYRHLLEDIRTLVPHHKKESKLDPGNDGVGRAIADIAQMRSCQTVLYLECRKRQDAYMWIGNSAGGGPSARFHLSNIHTMDELKLTGNCMKGSRPILNFDESFGRLDHLKLLKHLFVDIFGTPRGHPKSKPFVDRIMSFFYADNKIWVRNYQIVEQQPDTALEARLNKKRDAADKTSTSLVEIGPRFVLNPIRIFRGSFGGQTLYQNPEFISPNAIRAQEGKDKGKAYENRKAAQKRRKEHKEDIDVPVDPLADVFK